MFQRITFVFTIFTLLTFIISSCSSLSEDELVNSSNSGVLSMEKPLFDRESELIEVLKTYQIPTDETKLVLMPPTKCASCKLGALKAVDSLKNIYILTVDSTFYDIKDESQKLICYDEQLINKKGLVKLYSAIIDVKDEKVMAYHALVE